VPVPVQLLVLVLVLVPVLVLVAQQVLSTQTRKPLWRKNCRSPVLNRSVSTGSTGRYVRAAWRSGVLRQSRQHLRGCTAGLQQLTWSDV